MRPNRGKVLILFAHHFKAKTPLSPETRMRVLDDVRRRIQNAAPLRAIVFGSFADRTETEDSDIDILVICSDEAEIKCCRDKIYADLHGPITVLSVDFIFVTETRFQEMSLKGGVCMVAKNSGFDLWVNGND